MDTMMSATLLAFCLFLCIQFSLYSAAPLAPLAMLSPADEDHRHALRRALFGGEPHLSFCADSKINLDDFITKVRKGIGDENPNKVVRTAIIECDEVLSSGTKSLRNILKLKEPQPGEPVILWSANGDKPEQLAMTVYTSEAKESKKDKKDKKKKKKDKKGKKEKGVKVELDPDKLSEYVLKHRPPKLGAIAASPAFKKQCLGRKYQVCGIIAHKGDLSQTERKFWLKIASQNRSMRLFTLDTLQHKMSGVLETSAISSASSQLTLFRRDAYSYSGPIARDLGKDVAEKISDARRKLEQTNVALRLPTEVESMGPRVRVSRSLRAVLKKAHSPSPRSERMVEFRKEEIETGVDFNLEEQKDDIIVLLREGNLGFFLDWERAAAHLIGKAAFDEIFDEDKLGELQLQTLTRASSKPTSIGYVHFDGDLANSTDVAAFLGAAVLEDMPMNSAQKEPNIIKRSKPARKTLPTSKRPSDTKKSKKSESKDSNRKRAGKGSKGTKRKETEQERVEREQKRRLEMEKEAEDLIALEVCEDGQPCEEDSADSYGYDDRVNREEEAGDSEDGGAFEEEDDESNDDGFIDLDEDEDEGDVLDLDDF